MTISRHFVFVEQTIGGKAYRQKCVAYNITDSNAMMLMCMRLDESLYRKSGAILPSRKWWVEEAEF